MKKIILGFAAAVAFVLCFNIPTLNIEKSKKLMVLKEIPKPITEHPRVLINKTSKNTLKDRLNDSRMSVIKDKIYSDMDLYKTKTDNDSLRRSFEANAFYYTIYGDKTRGEKAVSLAIKVLSNLNLSSSYNDTQNAGRMILGGAFVYDWCNDLISSSDKTKLISLFKSVGKKLEIGYPVNIPSSITSHASGNPLMRDLMAAGIATYNEDKEIYDMVADKFFNEYVPARNFAYTSGMHYQGSNYGTGRFEGEIFSSWLFATMGIKNVYDGQKNIPYYTIYSKRPDGKFLPEGDVFDTTYYSQYSLIMAAGLYNDPYIAGIDNNIYRYRDEPLFYMITYDPNIGSKKPNDLALSRYFSSPQGLMMARTSWNDGISSDTALAEFKIGEYNFANHSHLDAGSFQLYYKGPLAIDSGVYEGNSGGYGSSHDINYNKRSIAHNVMIVNNPSEKFTYQGQSVVNDGGQRFPNGGNEAKNLNDLLQSGYQTGDIMANWIGTDILKPEFTYLKGDLTKAYTSKIESYQRSFVFINLFDAKVPAALVVLDKVRSSTAEYSKKWLLHSITSPSVNNNKVTIVNNKNGYNGKLTNECLYPIQGDFNINVVGGSGKEFYVNGKNYPNTPSDSSVEPGVYRTEISPKTAKKDDIFLNVMQITNADSSNYYNVTRIEQNQVLGVKISNRVVIFSKNSGTYGSTFNESFKINSVGTESNLHYLITDLKQGTWDVYCKGTLVKTGVIDTANPVINFESAAGDIELKIR